MRELHWTAKTEQKLALGGWHSANALALLFRSRFNHNVYILNEKSQLVLYIVFDILITCKLHLKKTGCDEFDIYFVCSVIAADGQVKSFIDIAGEAVNFHKPGMLGHVYMTFLCECTEFFFW